MEHLASTIADRGLSILAGWGEQLGGTFLAVGSPYSIGSLACTFALLVWLSVRGRRRPVPLAVLRRALFPRRLIASASGRADLVMFVFAILFSGSAIGWAIVSADTVRGWLSGGMPTGRTGWGIAVAASVVLFLAYEFAYWLDHWLKHRLPLLWHFHKVHHQAETLSLLTNARVHLVDSLIFYNIVAVTMGVAGALLDRIVGVRATPLLFGGTNLAILVFQVANTHLQHSSLWVGFGPRWGRVLLGPAHHQIHHSIDPQHYDRNFGSSLALFDRAFGTLHLPAATREPLRFGVSDGSPDPHGLHALTLAPFVGVARDAARVMGPVLSEAAKVPDTHVTR